MRTHVPLALAASGLLAASAVLSLSGTASAATAVTNAGFETGDLTGWSRSGTTSIVTSGAHSGQYAAQLGSTVSPTDGDSTVTQTFTAPSGDTQLSFWYDMTCPDDVTYDWATAQLKDNTTGTATTVLPHTCTLDAGWKQVTASVTAGHSYTLAIVNHDENNPGDATATTFDDVTVNRDGSGGGGGGGGNVINVSTTSELKSALGAARPGDTIRLADGTYSGNFATTVSGTSGAPITLVGSSNAVLKAGDSGYVLYLNGASYWTIKGINISGGQKGIMMDGANHTVIDSVAVHGQQMEGVHFRKSSSDGVIQNSRVYDTGRNGQGMGEGVYVGTANTLDDHSDRDVIKNNTIGPNVGGEGVDIKEGTVGAKIVGNSFDGTGMTDNNYDDSWVDVKGNDVLVQDNTGKNTLNDGFQVHQQYSGWGCNSVFRGNHSDLTGASGSTQYAINITDYNVSSCPATVDSTNTVIGGNGLTNPGVPSGDLQRGDMRLHTRAPRNALR